MTQKSQPLPGMGGSFTRKKDGTLVPRQAEAEPAAPSPAPPETPAAPETEPVQDKPAVKPAKPTAKDA